MACSELEHLTVCCRSCPSHIVLVVWRGIPDLRPDCEASLRPTTYSTVSLLTLWHPLVRRGIDGVQISHWWTWSVLRTMYIVPRVTLWLWESMTHPVWVHRVTWAKWCESWPPHANLNSSCVSSGSAAHSYPKSECFIFIYWHDDSSFVLIHRLYHLPSTGSNLYLMFSL